MSDYMNLTISGAATQICPLILVFRFIKLNDIYHKFLPVSVDARQCRHYLLRIPPSDVLVFRNSTGTNKQYQDIEISSVGGRRKNFFFELIRQVPVSLARKE